MTYDEFNQVLTVPIIDANTHVAIVLNFPPCDQDSVLAYFNEHAENIKNSYYRYYNGRVYMVLNNDIVLKDTLVEYETVSDIPVFEPDSSGDNL